MQMRRFIIHIMNCYLALLIVGQVRAQTDSLPCPPLTGNVPRVASEVWCYEVLLDAPSLNDPLVFSALIVGESGTLYATRPQQHDFVSIQQVNDDVQIIVIADNLPQVNSLARYGGAIYIAGAQFIYRYDETSDTLITLIDDLPYGGGMWTGGIAIDDTHIYVGISAPCDNCLYDDPERGAILRYTHEGDERYIMAQGLRYPMALAIIGRELWVSDIARSGLAFREVDRVNKPHIWYSSIFDEVNVIMLDDGDTSPPHFGYPHCIGINNVPDPDLHADFDCSQASMPYMTLETHSYLTSILPYVSSPFDEMQGTILMAEGGSFNRSDIRGFNVMAFFRDGYPFADNRLPIRAQADDISDVRYNADGDVVGDDDQRRAMLILLPNDFFIVSRNLYEYEGMMRHVSEQANYLNYIGGGIYPRRILGMATDAQGKIYLSLQGGRIITLTPRPQPPR